MSRPKPLRLEPMSEAMSALERAEAELRALLRETKIGWFGEHVRTRRRANAALEAVLEVKEQLASDA